MEVVRGCGLSVPAGAPYAGAPILYFEFLNTWHVRPILDPTIIS
jgi:hypothetical protein